MKIDKVRYEFLDELNELIDGTEFTNGIADLFTCLMGTIIAYGVIPHENDEIEPKHKIILLIEMFEKVAKDYLKAHFGPSPDDG